MTTETNIKKLLTVGIPFYNGSNIKGLQDSIDSIINQTLPADCIHLIQDGPINDKLKSLIDEYKKKYSNIKILELPKKGLPYALNQSIMHTKTKYYARMDSDDISFKDRFEKQVDYLNNHDNIEIIGSWAIEFDKNHKDKNNFILKKPNDEKKIFEQFHYMSPLIHPSVIFRVSVFNKIGFYDETFYDQKGGCSEDLELWARALKNKIRIYNIQEPLLYYRITGRLDRRSQADSIKRQIRARYAYNTISIKLNILKIFSIFFRILPKKIRNWAYNNLR